MSRPPKVSCSWEKLEKILADPGLPELLQTYWEELSPYKDKLPVVPDWPTMLELEAEGRFKVWVCRADGMVAGFISFHLLRHISYATTKMAIDGGHYLAPQWRDKGRIGYRMWSSAKRALKEEGCQFAMLHDNATRHLTPFFLALGAEPRSTIYWLDLGEC